MNDKIEEPSRPITEPSWNKKAACFAKEVDSPAEAASVASRSSISTQSATSLGIEKVVSSPK